MYMSVYSTHTHTHTPILTSYLAPLGVHSNDSFLYVIHWCIIYCIVDQWSKHLSLEVSNQGRVKIWQKWTSAMLWVLLQQWMQVCQIGYLRDMDNGNQSQLRTGMFRIWLWRGYVYLKSYTYLDVLFNLPSCVGELSKPVACGRSPITLSKKVNCMKMHV